MSRYNLGLREIASSKSSAIFKVVTGDFNKQGIAEEVGELVVDFEDGSLSFTPMGIWEGANVVPIDVFCKDPDEARRLLSTDYLEFEYTDWIYRIFRRAEIIRKGRNEDEPESE